VELILCTLFCFVLGLIGVTLLQGVYGASTCAVLVLGGASLALKHCSVQSGYPRGCGAYYGTGHQAKERNAARVCRGITGRGQTAQIAPNTSTYLVHMSINFTARLW